MKIIARITIAASAALMLAAGGAAIAKSTTATTAASASALARTLRSAIQAAPRGAMQPDIEAALIYAIDQSGQPIEVVLSALSQIDTTGLSPAAQNAIAAVTSNRARVAQRGTGSIAGGPTIGLAFGAALSITGGSNTGSSDYGR